MRHQLLRRAGFALAAAAGVALVVCAFTTAGGAVAGFTGIGFLGLSIALFESVRKLIAELRKYRRELAKLSRRVSKARRGASAREKRQARSFSEIGAQLKGVRRSIDQMPSQTVELHRKYDQLVTEPTPMPGFGSWAASAPTVLTIVDEVLANPSRSTVLECGSGASTVWVAAAFAHRGNGHVFALEHDPRFAQETRGYLAAHGLSDWATVLDAPLVETAVPGMPSQPWYDRTVLDTFGEIDILFVDGPPGNTSALARYPAWPLLSGHMRVGSLIALDDTHRAEERRIRDLWLNSDVDAFTLHVAKVVDRTTFLEVGSRVQSLAESSDA